MKLYQSINKLPFTVFIEIIDTKNYKLLLLEGEASDELLEQTWNDLYAAYFDAANNDKEDHEVSEAKELASNYNRVSRARILLDAIVKVGPQELLMESLYEFGYDLPENIEKNTEIILKTFTANYKLDYVNLQINSKEQEEEIEEKPIIDGTYYMETVAVMMTGLKVSIDISTLTVGLYVALLKQYKQHCKSLLKLQRNG